LIKQKNSPKIKYYVVPELKNLFQNNGFKVITTYGDYQKNSLDINSKRIILVVKKIKNSPK